MTFSINKIDTSYWQLDDDAWVANREKNWSQIEYMVSPYKQKKKNRTIVKNYYLRGKMPNWAKLKAYDCSERHLDIFLFLWLHPSSDRDILVQLRNLYFESELVELEDLVVGYKNFLDSQINVPIGPYTEMRQVNFPRLEGDTGKYFDLLMGIRKPETVKLKGLTQLGKKRVFTFPKAGISRLSVMGCWLVLEKILPPVHYGFLFQYDDALEWWYESFEGLTFERLSSHDKRNFPYCKFAMLRIHNFDTEKEGNTCRTQFVLKIRSMLDERDFFPEFKQLWLDIKAGNYDMEEFKGFG